MGNMLLETGVKAMVPIKWQRTSLNDVCLNVLWTVKLAINGCGYLVEEVSK
jgi:hypothetical protein